MSRLGVAFGVIALASSARADDPRPALDRPWLHAELDPFPFATLRYGGQIGIRHPALHGLRVAVASFALRVPDPITELPDNDGWNLEVQPSAALYVLYYAGEPGQNGFAFGGALRYLRLRYTHDEVAGSEALVRELSPELIAAYQWHPFANGFYLQPWLGLSVTLARDGEATVGDSAVGSFEYEPLPVQPFFTVNLGWELAI